jgi:cell wall hydrolase
MRILALGVVLWLAGSATASENDDQERRTVAAVLVAEAGGEGQIGMEAVAEVILQRSRADRESLFCVVTRPRQFSCLNGTTIERLVEKSSRHARFPLALAIVDRMIGDPDAFPRRTNGADHFSRKDEAPYWARGRTPVAVVGNHAFYRLRN